ncbi:DUF1360 domain-containing protein [Streptomyces morookaense]|uniref:DUF1360 domain-containing protein n=1 Tax=Streptomyces morookaense TaxID=1970 RepID=A0A7Y7AZX5_STRMO|nr:DUF1360 domain-containing protein [Streptomyces morookaense]NVK76478.1 DUF1360 domain-containing protein [Streptomyces morookaense]GHF07380.1 hypothetical protein GCM10010359_05600 [Streptomyces morookaense]
MTSPEQAGGRPRRGLGEEAEAYTAGTDHPLGAYAGAMGVYVAGIAALAGLARATRRELPDPTPWDVLLCAGATHRLSRLVSKDPVTSPLRAPFARYRGTSGPAELEEEVRGRGARKAVGELLTCPFRTGMWITTGIAAGMVFAPRATRLATATLTALTGSDFLHFVRVRVQQAAGEQ